jgi:tetratricopeptide (TPR) repeat protein/tRNA A-37 threonylcarbamoyl transferase component Bud32
MPDPDLPGQCTATVNVIPRGGPWPAEGLAPSERLGLGARVGRYVIVGTVGEGGMGVVYAGYDPELDRKVALKVLRPERAASPDARARLLREAQAIAKLSHPNVVAVHDAGAVGEQVFVAMEYVDGRTLRQWLRSPSPPASGERAGERWDGIKPWRERVELFRLAGQGLAAAHAAGLVHRDFKPDNVLIGKDGRVRVADFGLARPVEREELEETGVSGDRSPGLTSWGMVLGTPGYMAPEQLRGLASDARSDQFSFCVALYEALYGEKPFAGEDPDEMADAAERGEVRPPRPSQEAAKVPAWLREVVLRGLSADPARRWGSMDELLRELARDPAAVRRRWLIAALVLLAGGGLLAWGSALGSAGRLCSGAGRKLAGVWDEGRKAAVRASFLGTRQPYAAVALDRVETLLDGYAGDWTAMHREACEASRVRGEQSEDLLDRRMFCLDQRLREVDALAGLFSRADNGVVERSVALARGLTRLDACADVASLTARMPPPRDPALRARVERVRSAVAEVKTWIAAGKQAEAEPRAAAAVAAARQVDYRPTQAEALFLQGYLQDLLGETETAEATTFDALVTAQGAGHLEIAARSASELGWITGYSAGRPADGERWARLAAAIADALPGDDALHAELLRQRAVVLYTQGRFDEAVKTSTRALARAERAYGPDHPEVARILSNLGAYYNELGDNETSLRASLRGLAIRKKVFGPNHPDLAKSYNTLGNAYHDLRRYEEARTNQELACAIFRESFGPDHPQALGVLNNIANIYKDEGRYAEAESRYREVIQATERNNGPDHPDVAMALADLGEALLLGKRHAEALETYRRALSINEKALGPNHPSLAFDLQGIGRSLVEMSRAAEAVPFLERALAIRESSPLDPDLVSNVRYNLAQALWEAGRKDRSLKLAHQALDGYATSDSEQEMRREVEDWLREREAAL